MRRILRTIGRQNSRLLWRWYPNSSLAIALEWKPADLWIGAYVYTHANVGTTYEEVNLYLIVVPTIVLHIAWLEHLPDAADEGTKGRYARAQRWIDWGMVLVLLIVAAVCVKLILGVL